MKTTIVSLVFALFVSLVGYAVKNHDARLTVTETRIETILNRELPSVQRIAALEAEMKALNAAMRDLRDEQRITNAKLDELIFNTRFKR